MKILKNIAALMLTLFLLWGTGLAVFAGFVILAKPAALPQNVDAIVVLTGGEGRVQEGLALFAGKTSRQLFISGVHKDVTMGEFTGLWQGKKPLPPCCITLGYEATSTEQNATETSRWIKDHHYKSIRLVTGNYHMPRSLLELHHALPDVKITIHPVKQTGLGLRTRRFWILLLLEYHKSLYRGAQLLFLPQA